MFSGIYNQSCLVKYEKYLYKIKLMYKDINPLTNIQTITENSVEIEEVIRAILNLFMTDTQVPSRIVTQNYLINISIVFWKITKAINFYSNGKKMKCKFYIKLSIYSNQSMRINYMTDNDTENCKMKQKFPLPSASSSSSYKYICNKGPLTNFRNVTITKKHQLITNGIDAAFKEHFVSHSNYFGEHLSHPNIHGNFTSIRKAGLFCGNETENYNTLFLHCHSKNNLKLPPKLQLDFQLNSSNVSVFNNNPNYKKCGEILKIQLKQNAIKTKKVNSLQYFTVLINQCKLSQEYSIQFGKYTEYNLSAFNEVQKIKSFLRIKTVVIKRLTCCSLKYRITNQITGTYIRKNRSHYSAKKKHIWLEGRLKRESLKETVRKTCFIQKISFKNPVRKWKLRKENQKKLRMEDPEKLRKEDPEKLGKEDSENLRMEDPEKLRKADPEKLKEDNPEKLRKEDPKFKECDKVSSFQNIVTEGQNEIFFKPNDRYTVQIQELQEDLKLQNLANLSKEFD